MTHHLMAHRLCLAHRARRALAAGTFTLLVAPTQAQTLLADQPVFSTLSVPGNLALALSVEFPTAITAAHPNGNYSSANTYIGYFDPRKCYDYSFNTDETLRHFFPTSVTTNNACAGAWSGNFMNWATMQAIDPFRWALTGGFRYTQTSTTTILEKAWAAAQGGTNNFPDRTLSSGVSGATPLAWTSFSMRVWGAGNKLKFTQSGKVSKASVAYDGTAADADTVYDVSVRVRVCDPALGIANLEPNCTLYGSGGSTVYRPTGLMQKYSNQIRYSAFGYLNDSNIYRDGGVLRAQQKFIGPTQPMAGSDVQITNGLAEWSASTGIILTNPDSADAADTASSGGFNTPISNSGVMNYLNKFGSINRNTYKTYDPVGELYYATLRYFKNQGNVPEWTAPGTADAGTRATWADGFPVITRWNDPIQYSCQKNFVLGIGDANTHADRNLPGATGSTEPGQPASVVSDTTVNSVTWTDRVGMMSSISNLGSIQTYNGCCNNNGALMAGLAYYANTQDIRDDLSGRQSVQTYWLDVLENGYKTNNQYYLATKYGGFTVPDGFDATRTADLPASWWRTNTDMVGSQARPDNYFTAAGADLMVAGLSKAFASIASQLKSYTTSFSTSLPQVATTGVGSYATLFDAKLWSGELIASSTDFDVTTGVPSLTEAWKFSSKLESQASLSGWDTGRVIVSYNTSTKLGVPFRTGSLSSSQVNALDTIYVAGNDSGNYLNYLRGERKNEVSSTDSGSTKAYRDRSVLVGDIVNAKARAVGAPTAPYGDAANPGYSAFKTANKTRKTMVYVGTNQGMLHAVDGSLTGTSAGQEVFAYVPGALYTGPTNTPATNGLQSIGRSDYVHYNMLDATPVIADVDFGRTDGGSGTVDWRSLLIGGLGKGGRTIYALDVTNPAAMTSETLAAGKVLWEFTDADLGFGYGEPAIVKTRKFGWVVIFGSGHNNADGKGYLFIVNPRTGALLKKIATGIGSTGSPAGMAHVQAFLLDLADGTADTVYAGDLLGNLWRFDLTSVTGDYTVLKLAELKDASGVALPVTSRPLIVVQPLTNRRFVTVGTGRLLHPNDISNTQAQRFFALMDGQAARFNATTNLPAAISFPIKTSNLKQLTDLSQKVTLDLTTQIGWYVDLGQLGTGAGWRITTDATSFYGIVSFATMGPSSSNPCEPSGLSRIYAIDLGTGQSRLASNATYLDTTSGVVTDLRFYSVAGKARLLVGTDLGKRSSPPVSFNTTAGVRRLNWREVPLTQ